MGKNRERATGMIWGQNEERERERERGNVDGQNSGGLFANVDVPSRGRIRHGQCHGGQKGSRGGMDLRRTT